ncbi:MAG: serine/threonine protein kinase [Planctomycetes bacterium]|nr:serine/threonine protein kinase [Planctomycetota bacterium]
MTGRDGERTVPDRPEDAAPRGVPGESTARTWVGPGPMPHLEERGYEIERVLGQGGMGVVYAARQASVGRTVAIKTMTNPGEVARERMRREARIAGSLGHPGIVQVYDLFEDGDRIYIVMQYVEGRSLAQRIDEKGPVPEPSALAIVRQVALALQFAHEHGVVHRDVKPGNILLARENIAKLADLGLARSIETQGAAGITRSGMVLGSALYMSPEQFDDPRRADRRSDIYSLGATLYHALTGRPPFEGEGLVTLANRHTTAARPDPRAMRPGITKRASALTRRMMARRPEDRFQEMSEVVAAIDAPRAVRVPARTRPLAAVLLAAFLVASAATALWLLRSGSEDDRTGHPEPEPAPGEEREPPPVAMAAWSRLAPEGEIPPGRWGEGYLASGSHVAFAGGVIRVSPQECRHDGRIWILDSGTPPRWRAEIFPAAPRSGAAFAYRASRDEYVVIGGWDDERLYSDIWTWSTARGWREHAFEAPAGTLRSAAFDDPEEDRIVWVRFVAGESVEAGTLSYAQERWTWTPFPDAGIPRAIDHFELAFDEVERRAYIVYLDEPGSFERRFAVLDLSRSDRVQWSSLDVLPDPAPIYDALLAARDGWLFLALSRGVGSGIEIHAGRVEGDRVRLTPLPDLAGPTVGRIWIDSSRDLLLLTRGRADWSDPFELWAYPLEAARHLAGK